MRYLQTMVMIVVLCADIGCSPNDPTPDAGVAEVVQPTRDDDTGCGPSAPCTCECPCTPLALSLEDDEFQFTDPAGGVIFAMEPGHPRWFAWTAGNDDAWLVRPGANGVVDDGAELFGGPTLQPYGPTRNAYNALAFLDRADQGGHQDGQIDDRDAVWPELRAWLDLNHNGISEPGELLTMARAGVHVLTLDSEEETDPAIRNDAHGNELRLKAPVTADAPAAQVSYDVWLRSADVVQPPPPPVGSTNSYLPERYVLGPMQPMGTHDRRFLGYLCTAICYYVIYQRNHDALYSPCRNAQFPVIVPMIQPRHNESDPDGAYVGLGARATHTYYEEAPSDLRDWGTLYDAEGRATERCLAASPDMDFIDGQSCIGELLGQWRSTIPEGTRGSCQEVLEPLPPPPPPPGPGDGCI